MLVPCEILQHFPPDINFQKPEVVIVLQRCLKDNIVANMNDEDLIDFEILERYYIIRKNNSRLGSCFCNGVM